MTSIQLYEESLPYFKLHGLEPKYEQTKEFYEILSSILGNITPENYYKAVFYKSYTEQYYPKAIAPRILISNWAIRKFSDYNYLLKNGDLSPENLDLLAVDRWCTTNKRNIFESKYAILPVYLQEIREWKIPLLWCVLNPKFWNMYRSLDKDIREDFFYAESLHELEDAVNKNIDLYKKVKQYI